MPSIKAEQEFEVTFRNRSGDMDIPEDNCDRG